MPHTLHPHCRERERERRLDARDAHGGKRSKLTRDRERDISEKIALGQVRGGICAAFCFLLPLALPVPLPCPQHLPADEPALRAQQPT